MPNAPPLQMLTANRLRTGAVVYWDRGIWVDQLAEAEIFVEAAAAESALARVKQFAADRIVVNPYLFAVGVDEAAPRPLEEREIVRAAGPTVRADIGKQQAKAACHV